MLIYMARVMIQFPAGCWPEILVPCHMGLSIRLLRSDLLQSESSAGKREQKGTNKNEAIVFYCLNSKATSYHFYHQLFIRNKSLGQTNLQRKEIIEGNGYQEVEIILIAITMPQK